MNVTENLVLKGSTEVSDWFDDFFALLNVHQWQLENNAASSEMKSFYEALFSKDENKILLMNKQLCQEHFVKLIIWNYIEKIKSFLPLKLGFDYNDSKVLVWAEVNDNDENIEYKLIMAEAEINAKFHQYGFDMASMIVEKSDNLPVPKHYRLFSTKA